MSARDDEPGEELGALLSGLLNVVVAREAPILKAHGLTMWEYVILSRLMGESGLTQKELARRSRRDPTRLIGHLDALDDRHLIAREVDGSDRRRRTVRLTAEGRDLVLATHRDIRQMETDLLGGLSAEAQNELRNALATVLRRNS
ncbi:MarR family winged helix-turn-helix transcriptional regulator [Actinacidiphila guanduensis]|uniref:DNA-binding transcriptional regulator, MarR family n=1 Tax=Actinacidiphila guanduensis TaxID=310781 RepID=A0A1G9VDS5_9ACTN|nr:MarR family transcriptional regulator [Actinacidiphila guanduensis]SDM70372.1 DNA-binding transcriptional regulator, MarR family [Actinacidiphila guanduensis]